MSLPQFSRKSSTRKRINSLMDEGSDKTSQCTMNWVRSCSLWDSTVHRFWKSLRVPRIVPLIVDYPSSFLPIPSSLTPPCLLFSLHRYCNHIPSQPYGGVNPRSRVLIWRKLHKVLDDSRVTKEEYRRPKSRSVVVVLSEEVLTFKECLPYN